MSDLAPSRLARADRTCARAGFLMIDLLLALAVMAMIASLALPFVRAGGQAGLRTSAAEIASLLRSSRNAALLSGQVSIVTVDAAAGLIRASRPAGSTAAIPRGATIGLDPAAGTAIAFTPDGRSSGGRLILASGRARFVVRVNPQTAAVDIAAP